MRRRLFKYIDIKHCYVEETVLVAGYMEYQIMLKNRNDVSFAIVGGLLGTQLFADKVNAMIAQQHVATTPTLNAAPV